MKKEIGVEENKISVLYEDDGALAIFKPSGFLTHEDDLNIAPSVTDWIKKNYPEIVKTFENKEDDSSFRPGIVHRLDRDTSGVLLIAKNEHAFGSLKKQFANRLIKKEYHALVYGTINEERGVINRPLGRSRKDFRIKSAQRKARGEMKEAVTVFEVSEKREDRLATFVKAYPRTGRMHQIRAHMKAIHHPVVCDPLYAPKQECLFGLNRLALHAYRISFKNTLGKEVSVIAPYPNDFAKAMEAFRKE